MLLNSKEIVIEKQSKANDLSSCTPALAMMANFANRGRCGRSRYGGGSGCGSSYSTTFSPNSGTGLVNLLTLIVVALIGRLVLIL